MDVNLDNLSPIALARLYVTAVKIGMDSDDAAEIEESLKMQDAVLRAGEANCGYTEFAQTIVSVMA